LKISSTRRCYRHLVVTQIWLLRHGWTSNIASSRRRYRHLVVICDWPITARVYCDMNKLLPKCPWHE
jgi:hypothetical protein